MLFLLYINDMAQIVGEEHVYLYADDTVLYVSDNNLNTAQSDLQRILDRFVTWSQEYKLTINTRKTKTMTFFPPKNIEPGHVKLLIGNCELENVPSYKYLGYLLDTSLTYNELMKRLIQKITYKLYLLAKLRPMLTKYAALTIYKSKIMPYIDYNLLLYTSARKQNQQKLQILQNRAIRIILKLPRRSNVDLHHIALKIWHVETRYRYFLLKYAYTLAHTCGEEHLDRREISTRSHDGIPFVIPARCSSKYMNSFAYLSRISWNCLNPEVQLLPTTDAFMAHVRRMLRHDEMCSFSTET